MVAARRGDAPGFGGREEGARSRENLLDLLIGRFERVHGNEQRSWLVRGVHERSGLLRAEVLDERAGEPFRKGVDARESLEVVVRVAEGEFVLEREDAVQNGVAQARRARGHGTDKLDTLVESRMRGLFQEDELVHGNAQRIADVVEGVGRTVERAVDELVERTARAHDAEHEQRRERAVGRRQVRFVDHGRNEILRICVTDAHQACDLERSETGGACLARMKRLEAVFAARFPALFELGRPERGFLRLPQFARFAAGSDLFALPAQRIELAAVDGFVLHETRHFLRVEGLLVARRFCALPTRLSGARGALIVGRAGLAVAPGGCGALGD